MVLLLQSGSGSGLVLIICVSQLNGLDGRDVVCRELDLSESELNRNCPLLLELIRRGRHKHGEVRESANQLSAA